MDIEALTAERDRFSRVMRARTSDAGLLELIRKLVVSDKFSDAAKPYCYADLIKEAVSRIKDKAVPVLLAELERVNAVRMIRAVLTPEDAEVLLGGVVRRAFLSVVREEEPLMEVFDWCLRVGASKGRGPTLCLAIVAGMTEADLDEICDLTFDRGHAYRQPNACAA